MGEFPHEVPIPCPHQAVLGNEGELGLDAAGVLKPDLMDHAQLIRVTEPGGLGALIILYLRPVASCQGYGLLAGEGGGAGQAPDVGQGPVVAVVGHTQPDLFRRDLGEGIFHHLPHIGHGRYGHGRTVGIAPFVWMVYLNTQAEKH